MTFDSGYLFAMVGGSSDHILKVKGYSTQFDIKLTLDDPCMTFDPSNVLGSSQGL